jgi:hypothetical protein
MSSINYHIGNNFPNRFHEAIFNIISYIPSRLSRRYWRTGLVVWINNKLAGWLLTTEGIKSIVKKFDKERAQKEYDSISRGLKGYRTLYSTLEKAKFLNNPETEQLIEGIVSNLYSAEATVRSIAFSESPSDPADRTLTEFASRLSLGSLSA